MRRIQTKKGMSQFEVIGYAVLALIVLLVSIFIFTKLSSGPSKTIGEFTDKTTNTDECIKNPDTCQPFKTQGIEDSSEPDDRITTAHNPPAA